jgi:RHS repeat-associated protein
VVAGATTTWTDYLFAGGARVAQRSMVAGGATSLRYFITDHLGSIAVITDGGGAVLERLAYDAWGKRRNTNGTDDPAGAVTSATTRGFTDHEHIASVGLVNMNGRVYDPELGRFLSADPIVPNRFNSQALNRFTYVDNRPLSLIDPTGYVGVAAEIVITAFRVNPVVGVVTSILSAIFGGLFGGHHAVAVQVFTLQLPPSPPPSSAAHVGGNQSGLVEPVSEGMNCGGGACEIVTTGVRTSAVAANSVPAAALAAIDASVGVSDYEVVVEGRQPKELPVPPTPPRYLGETPDTITVTDQRAELDASCPRGQLCHGRPPQQKPSDTRTSPRPFPTGADCEVQYDLDSMICRSLPTARMRAICWESASRRVGLAACLRGHPLPPLSTGP